MLSNVAVVVFKFCRYAIETVRSKIRTQQRYGRGESRSDRIDLGFVSFSVDHVCQQRLIAYPAHASFEESLFNARTARWHCSKCTWEYASEDMSLIHIPSP